MEKGDRSLLISILLFIAFILAGVIQSFSGYATSDNVTVAVSEAPKIGVYLSKTVFPRFLEIISSPFTTLEMLWIAVPLIIVLLFIQIYFGRWRNEKLGWSSAFANWITLFFVGVNLFREMIVRYSAFDAVPIEVIWKFFLIFLIFLMAISFMIILFLHAIPKSASYLISSPLTIYTFAFIMISIVYSDIPLDLPTLIASLLVYIVILIIFKIVKFFVPPSEQAKRYLHEKEVEKQKEDSIKKAVKVRKEHMAKKARKKKFNEFLKKLHLRS